MLGSSLIEYRDFGAFSRLPVRFCIDSLVRDLETIEKHQWMAVLADKPELEWRGLALRSHDGLPTTLDYQGTLYRETTLMNLVPYMKRVVTFFQCDLRRVRLLALHPGAAIGVHTDVPVDHDNSDVRLHLPIITNDAASFKVNDVELPMRPGDLWYVDISQPHSVANHGNKTRINMVIDCVLNSWLRDLLIFPGRPVITV